MTVEELLALPVGSLVRCEFVDDDGSVLIEHMLRTGDLYFHDFVGSVSPGEADAKHLRGEMTLIYRAPEHAI